MFTGATVGVLRLQPKRSSVPLLSRLQSASLQAPKQEFAGGEESVFCLGLLKI